MDNWLATGRKRLPETEARGREEVSKLKDKYHARVASLPGSVEKGPDICFAGLKGQKQKGSKVETCSLRWSTLFGSED